MEAYTFQESFRNLISRGIDSEQWLLGAFRAALLSKTGTFIDVGANTGQTLMKLLALDKERDYVGFEPQVNCCFFIDKFLSQNKLSRHSIFPIGLSSGTRIVQLFKRFNGPDDAASAIGGFRPDDFYTFKQSIYVTKGDDVLPEIGLSEIAIIKIDVEGGELEVVEGLKQTLIEHVPFVFFEVLNHFLVATGKQLDPDTIEFRENRTKRLEGILRELDYAIYNILPSNLAVEVSEIRSIVSGDLTITDYMAVHRSLKSKFGENFQGTVKPLE